MYMDFMAWLQQKDMDLTYLQVFELQKQETEGLSFKSLAPPTSGHWSGGPCQNQWFSNLFIQSNQCLLQNATKYWC